MSGEVFDLCGPLIERSIALCVISGFVGFLVGALFRECLYRRRN